MKTDEDQHYVPVVGLAGHIGAIGLALLFAAMIAGILYAGTGLSSDSVRQPATVVDKSTP